MQLFPNFTTYAEQPQLSRNVRKRKFEHVRLAKIQISLLIFAVWSESSLGSFWIAKDATFLHADNEDSDHIYASYYNMIMVLRRRSDVMTSRIRRSGVVC